ncbi:hypothetical protein M3689_17770 [Alkalihalophilus marmarensis]|nr:hypothetical protein [Alkalihalophilus marmarensis]MCM3491151.1 hypothetical protein [Alkalihalophilus marmarensis]
MDDNTNHESIARKRGVRIFFNIVFVVFIIGAISFFFDDNPYNVHLGWFTLLGLQVVASLYQMWIEIEDKHRWSAVFSFLLAVGALTLLIVRGMQYLI